MVHLMAPLKWMGKWMVEGMASKMWGVHWMVGSMVGSRWMGKGMVGMIWTVRKMVDWSVPVGNINGL